MHKSIKLGAVLLTVGTGSAVVTVAAAGHSVPQLVAASGLLSGACTALGVTSVIVGWASRRATEDDGR